MKRHIPNFITVLNLLTGVTGIWFVLEHNPYFGALMIFLSGLFDFLDGFLARKMNAYSDVGKSLDSLSDMVSFGVLPGFLVFRLQTISLGLGLGYEWIPDLDLSEILLLIAPTLIPAFSAIRLARFDNDPRQKKGFIGLPTPANAFFIAAWVHSYPSLHENQSWLYNPLMICAISTVLSVLLLSGIPMFSLKFSDFSFRKNILPYSFLIISLAFIILFMIPGVMLAISLYILLSLAVYFINGHKSKPQNSA